ncbi:MAG: hypothetical protein ABII06_14185 [Pseudomonadota bacterium]
MDSENKNKKRPYEPPQIFEMDVDLTQAMGATQCGRGIAAAGSCKAGPNPAGVNCSAGARAAVQCASGARPGAGCSSGSKPTM